MKPSQHWHLLGLVGVLVTTSSLGADLERIHTDTTWRAIGPLGNLEASPIDQMNHTIGS